MRERRKQRAEVRLGDGTIVGPSGLSIRDEQYRLSADMRRSVAAGWAACNREEKYSIVLMRHEYLIAKVDRAPDATSAMRELRRQYEEFYCHRRRKPKTGLVAVSTFCTLLEHSTSIAGMGAHVLFALKTTPDTGVNELDFISSWLGIHRDLPRALVTPLYKRT